MLDELSWISWSGANNGDDHVDRDVLREGGMKSWKIDLSGLLHPEIHSLDVVGVATYARHPVGVGVHIGQICSPRLLCLDTPLSSSAPRAA
jgi:hypothetical protein